LIVSCITHVLVSYQGIKGEGLDLQVMRSIVVVGVLLREGQQLQHRPTRLVGELRIALLFCMKIVAVIEVVY
jgi:hypothetical protein